MPLERNHPAQPTTILLKGGPVGPAVSCARNACVCACARLRMASVWNTVREWLCVVAVLWKSACVQFRLQGNGSACVEREGQR